MKQLFILCLALFLCFISRAQKFSFKKSKHNNIASFRGLSVVNDKIAWLGGSNGWIGISTNSGKSWEFSQIEGQENFSIRSVYAFDDKKAVVANAGSPAKIFLTVDGGNTWTHVYTNESESAFFDGIDFWNDNEGMIYGDPIDGKMLLLYTNDGGNSWTEVANRPTLNEGEASFAASGTGIRCIEKKKVIIATGGLTSRLWISEDKGTTWSTLDPPITQGENTKGIYSVAVDGSRLVIVGGDYTQPTLRHQHNLFSIDGGKSWSTPDETVKGYRECVEFISKNTLLSTGPTGTDISTDGGKNWQSLSEEEGFHTLRKARNGSLIIIAGNNGQISVIQRQ